MLFLNHFFFFFFFDVNILSIKHHYYSQKKTLNNILLYLKKYIFVRLNGIKIFFFLPSHTHVRDNTHWQINRYFDRVAITISRFQNFYNSTVN